MAESRKSSWEEFKLLEDNLIDLFIDMFLCQWFWACFCYLFSSCRANGMPDNSSTNALVSSIYGSMYYLGYVLFFHWLFLFFVLVAETATIWGRADANIHSENVSCTFFQFLLYRATIGPSLAGVLDDHFGFEWAMSVSAVFIIRGIWSTLRNLILWRVWG